MRPELISRLKEEWNNLDPVDPLRELIADAIDALAQPAQQEPQSMALNAAIGYIMRHTPKLVHDEICKALRSPVMVASPQPAQSAWTTLEECIKALDALNYIQGIAERGEGRKMRDDESLEQFVLGYVKKLEQQAQQREPITGWITWQGGDCPVDQEAIVDVRYRYDPNAVAHSEARASHFQWHDTGSTTDIVSFRVRGFAAPSAPPASKAITDLREALAEPRIEDNEIKNYLQTVASNNGYAHDNPRIYEIFCEVFAAGAKWQRAKTPVECAIVSMAVQPHCDDCGGFDPECPLAQPAKQQSAKRGELVGMWMGDCIEWTENPYKFRKGQPLYTSPPASKPLPFSKLCDIEHEITHRDGDFSILKFARAIEAAHGIGGQS